MTTEVPIRPAPTPGEYLGYLGTMLSLFTRKVWLVAVLGAIGTALLIAIPAAIIDNPIFGRTVDVRPQDYVLLAGTSLLSGLAIASYAVYSAGGEEGKATAGGFLSFVAVGCPVCNKVVVAAIGTSGALNVFAPAQLLIGVGALVLLGWALLLRARAVAGFCALPSSAR
ncbi:MAG: hypothetical protein AB7P33_07810 [Dehalococcoidia bacterium]